MMTPNGHSKIGSMMYKMGIPDWDIGNGLSTIRKLKMNNDKAKEQAKIQIDGIVELIGKLVNLTSDETETQMDDLRAEIYGSVLSIRVRTDWHTLGDPEDYRPIEFELLLCTGGPAVKICGDLDQNYRPSDPEVWYQDWYTLWELYTGITPIEQQSLKLFCEEFCFE